MGKANFSANKIKYFRGDEDFAKTISSLKTLLELDFDQLFCAHRPVPRGGKQKLKQKLDYLLSLEEKVRHLKSKGYSIKKIARDLLGPEGYGFFMITWGDVSRKNIVRSILEGAHIRPVL